MPSINQKALADALNLSQTTVSRALGNHPSINADTKAQVWRLAAEMGYKLSNPQKKTVASKGRPRVIGVMIAIPKRYRGPNETSQFILQGIAERSANESATLDVIYQEPTDTDVKGLQRRIRQRNWEGCILIHPMRHEIVERIAKTIPCVSVIENYRRDFIDSIDVDQTDGLARMVRQLHRCGHRKLGFLTWVYDVPTPWVYHRFGAYVESLFLMGMPFDPQASVNIQDGEKLDVAASTDKVIRLFESGVTGIVCAADHQAYDLWQSLERRGIRVPEDCSLTGFDGIPPRDVDRPLTTISVPFEEIGRSAYHQILHRISFPSAARRHVMVDGDIIRGVSVADLTKELSVAE